MPKKSLSAAVLLDADLFEGIQPQSQLECKPQSQLEWQEERLNVMGNGKQVNSWLLCTANFPLPEQFTTTETSTTTNRRGCPL